MWMLEIEPRFSEAQLVLLTTELSLASLPLFFWEYILSDEVAASFDTNIFYKTISWSSLDVNLDGLEV